MQKILVILGPTATGKSDLAVKIAQKFNGEIISADSRQVYKELNIGTGKITKKEMKGVAHHIIDIINPQKKFTVAEFKKLADKKLTEIINRNHLPIICGGTGFYIDAVIQGFVLPEVKANPGLRSEMMKKTENQLFAILKKIDPARAKSIDKNNKIRLIRAIEIAKTLGKVPKLKKQKPQYEFIKIGLKMPKEIYEQKVISRVKNMFQQGLLKEITKLKKIGVSKKRLAEFGFEYNEPTIEKVITGTIKYAKRQNTWFKRDTEINWFEIESKKDYQKIISFLKTKGLMTPKQHR